MRLIDADELLTAFPIDDEPMLTKSCVRMTIRHMPTIESEVQPVRHGHWALQEDRTKKLYGWHICSECGAWIGEPTNYCSNCGADMRGEQNERGKEDGIHNYAE